jgi:hypothetical protein
MADTINYCQVIEMTDEEKLVMYMKCTKKQLAEMLIQCNKHLEMLLHETSTAYNFKFPSNTEYR